jgi:hypothetical protein
VANAATPTGSITVSKHRRKEALRWAKMRVLSRHLCVADHRLADYGIEGD